MPLAYDSKTGKLLVKQLPDGTWALCTTCCGAGPASCQNTQARIILSGIAEDEVLCGDECLQWNDTYLLPPGERPC